MKTKLMEILVCPRCLGKLELRDEVFEKDEIIRGRLCCLNCKLNFSIENGVSVFGIKAEDEKERLKEINGENEWVFSANEIQEHIDFAINSSYAGEQVIRKIQEITKKERLGQKLRVLDVGAGWGCFQSWQFSRHGFEVVAAELCPEFVLASDCVAKDTFFERVVTDCTTLPFGDCCFDVVFCKELIHHVGNPKDLLNEMWRVTNSNGLIIIREPCTSILLHPIIIAKEDDALRVGITHYYYTYKDYINYMNQITSILHIERDISIINPKRHSILNILQKPVLTIRKLFFFRNIISRMYLIFIGGSVELIGIKKMNLRIRDKSLNRREVIPINIRTSNTQKIEFYQMELIPKVFNIFNKIYKIYK